MTEQDKPRACQTCWHWQRIDRSWGECQRDPEPFPQTTQDELCARYVSHQPKGPEA